MEACAHKLTLDWVRNPRPASGMFSSITTGLSFLLKKNPRARTCFNQPVDVPLIRPLTLLALHQKALSEARAICLPTFHGKTGHPPLIPYSALPHILAWQGDKGLACAMQKLPQSLVEVPDAMILHDMDKPCDYQRLCQLAPSTEFLHPREARELLRIQQVSAKGLRHGKAVGAVAAHFAYTLARARRQKGESPKLFPWLARSGGLLYDLAKGSARHEEAAANMLCAMQLPLMARLVRDHWDLTLTALQAISKRELVYLADKNCYGSSFVSLDQRFGQKIQNAPDPQSAQAIAVRRQHAKDLATRLAMEIGKKPEVLAYEALQQKTTFCKMLPLRSHAQADNLRDNDKALD